MLKFIKKANIHSFTLNVDRKKKKSQFTTFFVPLSKFNKFIVRFMLIKQTIPTFDKSYFNLVITFEHYKLKLCLVGATIRSKNDSHKFDIRALSIETWLSN